MGGSLVAHGGQNPIEPIRLETAVLHGPHVHNFADVYAALDRAVPSGLVTDAASLAEAVGALIADPALKRRAVERSAAALAPFSGALERTMAALQPFLGHGARPLPLPAKA